jgi:hypothetical protein
MFTISIVGSVEPKIIITNKSVSGVLHFGNLNSHFTLSLARAFAYEDDDLSIEVKYKDRVFVGDVYMILDSIYSLEIDLIDDFMNIYIIENNKNKELLSPISEYENQMILDRFSNKKIEINEDFLNNSNEFTKIIDK